MTTTTTTTLVLLRPGFTTADIAARNERSR